MYVSLSCTSQALGYYAEIKQAAKQAMKQVNKNNLKQASE